MLYAIHDILDFLSIGTNESINCLIGRSSRIGADGAKCLEH